MTREEVKVEFAGLAHDHLMVNKQHQHQDAILQNNTTFNKQQQPPQNGKQTKDNTDKVAPQTPTQQPATLSTIAILRRHPMYDSLVLVKRFRSCLNGFTLEFPTSDLNDTTTATTTSNCGDAKQQEDHQHSSDCCKTKLVSVYLDGDDPIYQCQEKTNNQGIVAQEGEIVNVPMNGLLDRLDKYDKRGISIDSRVYAFAMGLKTAEKFLTSSCMKEVQETPPL